MLTYTTLLLCFCEKSLPRREVDPPIRMFFFDEFEACNLPIVFFDEFEEFRGV